MSDDEQGVALAHSVAGERALPVVGGVVVLSKARLCRHVLVCGAPGSGKTETLLRLAWGVAQGTAAPVYYLDGKGDRRNAERFVGLMADAGRPTRVFPNEPLDGWRGEAHEIRGRLMEIVDYAREGSGAWYRDVAKAALGLACEHPQGPPRDSATLLARLDMEALEEAHGASGALKTLSEGQLKQVRLRYEAFFGETRGALDASGAGGGWAWEDTQAAYVLLDSLALHEETAGVARFMLEDFAHYFTKRKPVGDWCLMIVDEFSALAGAGGMARRVEQARGFDTALVLAPQVVAGMGGAEEAERILGSVETVVCHRANSPEEIVALAGTRQVSEYSTRFTRDGTTGEGSIQRREHFKVDPNRVRDLPTGEAFLISRGQAMRARILRAPQLRGKLPEPPRVNPPVPPGEKTAKTDNKSDVLGL
ncbi:MAG TPA: hypothetical protein VIC06_00925 [Solirubrobacteraceae bacterium]|jgi:hypothetical protein